MSTLFCAYPSNSIVTNLNSRGTTCNGSSITCNNRIRLQTRLTGSRKGGSQALRRNVLRPQASIIDDSNRTQKNEVPCDSSLEVRDSGHSFELKSISQDESSDTVLFSSAALLLAIADSPPAYSQASYYTTLGLFLLSLPGLWSLIKRSTKSKIVRRTFLVPGPKAEGARSLKQLAGEITAVLTKSNFKMVNSGETTTFEALFLPSRGQAAFITFCAVFGLVSLAIVLSVVAPDIGEKWYGISLLGPAAGVYYWKNATRTEQVQVKMIISDNELETDVMLQGDEDEVERIRKACAFMEKDKIYVKGLFEQT